MSIFDNPIFKSNVDSEIRHEEITYSFSKVIINIVSCSVRAMYNIIGYYTVSLSMLSLSLRLLIQGVSRFHDFLSDP